MDSRLAMLSVLGVRLLLDFEPSPAEAVDLVNKLVAGYMRVAYSAPKHREFLTFWEPLGTYLG